MSLIKNTVCQKKNFMQQNYKTIHIQFRITSKIINLENEKMLKYNNQKFKLSHTTEEGIS